MGLSIRCSLEMLSRKLESDEYIDGCSKSSVAPRDWLGSPNAPGWARVRGIRPNLERRRAAMNIDNALTDPAFFVDGDPHPIWRQLRREDPIHWTQGLLSK